MTAGVSCISKFCSKGKARLSEALVRSPGLYLPRQAFYVVTIRIALCGLPCVMSEEPSQLRVLTLSARAVTHLERLYGDQDRLKVH